MSGYNISIDARVGNNARHVTIGANNQLTENTTIVIGDNARVEQSVSMRQKVRRGSVTLGEVMQLLDALDEMQAEIDAMREKCDAYDALVTALR
jgi:acetyltransferase-like isoleucine patch superfamily enzyme